MYMKVMMIDPVLVIVIMEAMPILWPPDTKS